MKAQLQTAANSKLETYTFALAGLLRLAESRRVLDDSALDNFRSIVSPHLDIHEDLLPPFREYLEGPGETDRPLLSAAHYFGLTLIETLALRLAAAAEEDLTVGNLLAHLQQPLATTRPTVGLLARAFGEDLGIGVVQVLGQGAAVRCGLLQLSGDDLPLPERQVRVPLPICLALQGMEGPWPGTSWIDGGRPDVSLSKSAQERASELGERLRGVATIGPVLAIRSGDSPEARSAAEVVCRSAGMRGVFIQSDQLAGMAPWMFLNGLVPVFNQWLGPGERKSVPVIPSFPGPLILLTGPDGEFECDTREIIEWRLEIPNAQERELLWSKAIGNADLARRLAAEHRHTAGRIAVISSKAKEGLGERPLSELTCADVLGAARRGEACGLGALAELETSEVTDDALVTTPQLREELEALVVRCRLRDQFSGSLGPSFRVRYRPAVRALFVGPSGTGKTLAAGWLASRLGMPLFRVDLSAITSKYIGETEKNLSKLLTKAEQNEVLLLFDEADSLFGKRTDVQDANDRFANAQTNYLLQRLENYDGITLLTSNNRSRFDAAFSRRFDVILEFSLPGPEHRRALWQAHLGAAHDLTPEQLNLVAAFADLSGGQIRNAVLSSAISASPDGGTIHYSHLLTGLSGEYRKLNRQIPSELRQPLVAGG